MIKGFIVSVEDNPNDVELMKRVIHKELPDVEALFFDDTLKALDWFKKYQEHKYLPNLVLLDIKMPKMNGLELLKKIRELDVYRNCPIAILSSSDQLGDRDRAYASGANSYLEKSKSYTELKENLPLIARYWLVINK